MRLNHVHRATFSRQVCTTRRISGSSSISNIRLDGARDAEAEVADKTLIALVMSCLACDLKCVFLYFRPIKDELAALELRSILKFT